MRVRNGAIQFRYHRLHKADYRRNTLTDRVRTASTFVDVEYVEDAKHRLKLRVLDARLMPTAAAIWLF